MEWAVHISMPINFIRFICCFGVIFKGDECSEEKVDRDLSSKIIRYIAVFGDLCTYSPSLNFKFSNLELSLACLICAWKWYKVVPNSNEILFRIYSD